MLKNNLQKPAVWYNQNSGKIFNKKLLNILALL